RPDDAEQVARAILAQTNYPGAQALADAVVEQRLQKGLYQLVETIKGHAGAQAWGEVQARLPELKKAIQRLPSDKRQNVIERLLRWAATSKPKDKALELVKFLTEVAEGQLAYSFTLARAEIQLRHQAYMACMQELDQGGKPPSAEDEKRFKEMLA